MPELIIGTADFESLAAEILRAGNALRFRARGISMEPFIGDGDVVEVRPVDARLIRTGDVVLARVDASQLVVHRVVASVKRDQAVVLQGDALARPDGRVDRCEVLGRASALERAGKRVALDRGCARWLGLAWVWARPMATRLSVIARVWPRFYRAR